MKQWEQRLTGWGALIVSGVTLWVVYHDLRDHFHHPFAPNVGVKWEKKHVVGGVNTVPVQYEDALTLTNRTTTPLDNVAIVVSSWNNATEIVVQIGTLEPNKDRVVTLLGGDGFPRYPYEIDPRDVLSIRCPGYADKRIPMKELGKEKLLREIEKEEDKKNNADPQYWLKYRQWESELEKRGIEPTKEMYEKWLREKEEERNKKKHPT